MDQIKDAFQKVKNDIFSLKGEFELIKNEVLLIKNSLDDVIRIFNKNRGRAGVPSIEKAGL